MTQEFLRAGSTSIVSRAFSSGRRLAPTSRNLRIASSSRAGYGDRALCCAAHSRASEPNVRGAAGPGRGRAACRGRSALKDCRLVSNKHTTDPRPPRARQRRRTFRGLARLRDRRRQRRPHFAAMHTEPDGQRPNTQMFVTLRETNLLIQLHLEQSTFPSPQHSPAARTTVRTKGLKVGPKWTSATPPNGADSEERSQPFLCAVSIRFRAVMQRAYGVSLANCWFTMSRCWRGPGSWRRSSGRRCQGDPIGRARSARWWCRVSLVRRECVRTTRRT